MTEVITRNDLKSILEKSFPNPTDASNIYCRYMWDTPSYTFESGKIQDDGTEVTDTNYKKSGFIPTRNSTRCRFTVILSLNYTAAIHGYNNGTWVQLLASKTCTSIFGEVANMIVDIPSTVNQIKVTYRHGLLSNPYVYISRERSLQDIFTDLLVETSHIGTRYYASKQSTITTAGIDTHTTGATIWITPGVYAVSAQWAFNTRAASGTNTNSQCSIKNYTTNSIIASQRMFTTAGYYNTIQCSGIWSISDPIGLSVTGSSSQTYSSASWNWIHAVKIKDLTI